MRKGCGIVIIGLSLLWASVGWGATYYLDAVNGDDGYDGQSPTVDGGGVGPWQTVVYAEANADNGSIVYMATGNYGSVTIDRAAAGNRASWNDAITFTPYQTATPYMTQLVFNRVIDRYVVFDGVDITYDSALGLGTAYHILYIANGHYIMFKNATITGVRGKTVPENEYCDYAACSGDFIMIGNYSKWDIGDITIDNVIGTTTGLHALEVHYSNGPITVKNCEFYDYGASGLKVAGTMVVAPVFNNNVVHNEIPTYYDDNYSGTHHGSGFHLNASNVTFTNNIMYCTGNTSALTLYQEALDGAVVINGAWDDTDHLFAVGDTVTQVTSGDTGTVYKTTTAGGTQIQIVRETDAGNFDGLENIVSDTDAQAIWVPSSIASERTWGGYQNVTFENNLIYAGKNINLCIAYDVSDNCVFNNNTFIGRNNGRTGYLYFEYGFSFTPWDYISDPTTIHFTNNIVLGMLSSSEGIPATANFTGNQIWCYFSGTPSATVKDQDWMNTNFPGNTVWCESTGDETNLSTFTTAGNFFTGGGNWTTYKYTNSDVLIKDEWTPSSTSAARGYADTSTASSTEIHGRSRDGDPDAGAFEYGANRTYIITLK